MTVRLVIRIVKGSASWILHQSWHRHTGPGWNEVAYEENHENNVGRRILDCDGVFVMGLTRFGTNGERAGRGDFRNGHCQSGLRPERSVGKAYPCLVCRSS